MKKRSIRIARHRTSLSLETEFWDELKQIAEEKKISLNELVSDIDTHRQGNLSSSLRLYILQELKKKKLH